jgi:hypothetical protein
VVCASPGPLVGKPHHVRVYHPSLTAAQRRDHLSSLMARSACAVWSGLASAPLATAAVVTATTGSESAPTFAVAALAACAGGVVAWYRAGHGMRAVAAQFKIKHPGEAVVTVARTERLSDTIALTSPLLDRDGAQGARARQAVWNAARRGSRRRG